MEKEFLPYEEALALKELGFDELCLFFHEDGDIHPIYHQCDVTSDMVLAPLYQQAFRWFRNKHKLHAEIIVQLGFRYWNAQILPSGRWLKSEYKKGFKTYEEAELASIKKLIETVKTNNNGKNNKSKSRN